MLVLARWRCTQVMYGREEGADTLVEQMSRDQVGGRAQPAGWPGGSASLLCSLLAKPLRCFSRSRARMCVHACLLVMGAALQGCPQSVARSSAGRSSESSSWAVLQLRSPSAARSSAGRSFRILQLGGPSAARSFSCMALQGCMPAAWSCSSLPTASCTGVRCLQAC